MTKLHKDKNQDDFDEPEYLDDPFNEPEAALAPWEEEELDASDDDPDEEDLDEDEEEDEDDWDEEDEDEEEEDDWEDEEEDDDDEEHHQPRGGLQRIDRYSPNEAGQPRPQRVTPPENLPCPRSGFRRNTLVTPRWENEQETPPPRSPRPPVDPRKEVPPGVSRPRLGNNGPHDLFPKPTYNPARNRWQTHKSEADKQSADEKQQNRPSQQNVRQQPPAQPNQPPPAQPNQPPPWFVLQDVIDQHQPLPDLSAVLGVDQDGKPLVMSFADPSLGALLILGDDPADNRKHLNAILASAGLLNSPAHVQIDVVSAVIEAFPSTREDAHYLSRQLPGEDACDVLGELLDLLEQRAKGEATRPIRILVMDEVDSLVENLAPESLTYLRWLMRRGPELGIWLIGTLASHKAGSLDGKTLNAFGMHLYGQISDSGLAKHYAAVPPRVVQSLLPGAEACLTMGDDQVMKFVIPHVA